jgi:hypothetical protein
MLLQAIWLSIFIVLIQRRSYCKWSNYFQESRHSPVASHCIAGTRARKISRKSRHAIGESPDEAAKWPLSQGFSRLARHLPCRLLSWYGSIVATRTSKLT